MLLREVTRMHAGLRRLRVRCCRCRVHFLTSRSNRKRANLRCPFGCRKERKREKDNERGRNHYLTPKGRRKKTELNRKRSLQAEPPLAINAAVLKQKSDEDAPDFLVRLSVLQYIAALLRLSNRETSSRIEIESFMREILEWLRLTILRQRSLQGRGS